MASENTNMDNQSADLIPKSELHFITFQKSVIEPRGSCSQSGECSNNSGSTECKLERPFLEKCNKTADSPRKTLGKGHKRKSRLAPKDVATSDGKKKECVWISEHLLETVCGTSVKDPVLNQEVSGLDDLTSSEESQHPKKIQSQKYSVKMNHSKKRTNPRSKGVHEAPPRVEKEEDQREEVKYSEKESNESFDLETTDAGEEIKTSSSSSSCDDDSSSDEQKDLKISSRKTKGGFSSKGPYTCKDCMMEWQLKNDYNEHLVTVHNLKVRVHKPPQTKRKSHTFVCDICSSVFKVKTLFIQHMKEEHKIDKAFKCPVCTIRFTGPRNMNGHYNKYHNAEEGTKYSCEHCPKVFFLKNRLKRHMETHRLKEEPESTECTLCRIDYGSRQSLAQHMSLTHAIRKKNFMCEHCGKTYGSTHELKKHVNKHTGENIYPCDRCDERFLTSDKLKTHELRVHAGIEFKCELCSKQLSCLRNLKCHIKTVHLNQPSMRARRYQCPHCDLMCQSPAQRQIHLRHVHLKEKPFLCHLCDKTFSSQRLLTRHLDVHYEFKPHKCPHCDKSFSQKSNMEMHARTHTGEKPYVCVHCDKGFAQSSNLKAHMKQHGIHVEGRSGTSNKVVSEPLQDSTRLALLASMEKGVKLEVLPDSAAYIDIQ